MRDERLAGLESGDFHDVRRCRKRAALPVALSIRDGIVARADRRGSP